MPSCSQSASGSFAELAVAYGMPGIEVDGNDVLATYVAMSQAVEIAREGGGPALLAVKTYRMAGHSSSDDPDKYRDAQEVSLWEARDPLQRFTRFLEGQGLIDAKGVAALEKKIYLEIDKAVHEQEAADPMPLRSLVDDVYDEVPRHLRVQFNEFLRVGEKFGEASRGDGAFPL